MFNYYLHTDCTWAIKSSIAPSALESRSNERPIWNSGKKMETKQKVKNNKKYRAHTNWMINQDEFAIRVNVALEWRNKFEFPHRWLAIICTRLEDIAWQYQLDIYVFHALCRDSYKLICRALFHKISELILSFVAADSAEISDQN